MASAASSSGAGPAAIREVRGELRRRGLAEGRAEHRSAPAAVSSDRRDDAARRIALARRIWDAARDVGGSPVAAYLAGRGISTPLPPSLPWSPALRRPDGAEGPAMVARVVGLDTELTGVHRTWLDPDHRGRWHRRDRHRLDRSLVVRCG
jgi:hypothetical protein